VQPGDPGDIVIKIRVPCYVRVQCRPANPDQACHPIMNPCVWQVTGESFEMGDQYFGASGECQITD